MTLAYGNGLYWQKHQMPVQSKTRRMPQQTKLRSRPADTQHQLDMKRRSTRRLMPQASNGQCEPRHEHRAV